MERFLNYFVPERYVLDLEIDKSKKYIGGTVTVQGEVKAETVKFHAVNLSVDEVFIDGEKWDFETADGVLVLKKVPSGNCDIEIVYHGALNENMQGAYLSTYEYNGKTETIVATQFESHYAREAFPCIDEPAAKAVFELTITTDKDDLVLSNMPKLDSSLAPRPSGPSPRADGANSRAAALRDAPKNCLVSAFEATPRMSTYLLAWVIGKFHGKTVTNAHGVEITTYAALNQDEDSVEFANEIAAKSLEFYDDNFGVPYPLKRCLQVALPDFEAGAMENWGLVTYRESMLLAGKNATLSTKKGVALTVAHELSHQWFGDLVTMEWWDDLWLNESFASVMEYYAVDAIHPEYKIFENFFISDALAALRRDAYTGVQSVHQDVKDPAEIATLFDPAIVYAKGARLMLMLIRAMGWDDFCKGVSDYFEKYKYSNTVGDDLWQCLNPYAKFDVRELMHAFIDKSGYPVVKNEGVDFDKISQKRFLIDGKMEESNWPLPGISEDMSGHYVLVLTDDEFEERLARFDKLGLEEKLRLLIDRDLISKTELASAASLLPLIAKFKEEESAAVWSVILTIVGGLKVFVDYGSAEEKKLKKFVGDLVKPGLKRLGFTTRDDDDENTLRLRSILLALDFYAENKENLQELAKGYNSDYEKMDTETRADVLDAKLYMEPELIDKFLKDYVAIADPELKFELLFAGTVSRNKEVLKKMIALLDQPEIVKPQDQFHLFLYLYRNPCVRTEVFSWLTGHWNYVVKMSGDKSLDNYPRYTANIVRTEAEFEAWKKFFEPMRENAALTRAIEVGENEIKARLELIAADKEAVASWLN